MRCSVERVKITVDCLESFHRSASSSLHRDAAAEAVTVSAFLYSALRLPDCMELVNQVVIGAGDYVFRAYSYEDIDCVGTLRPRRPDDERPCSTVAIPLRYVRPVYPT